MDKNEVKEDVSVVDINEIEVTNDEISLYEDQDESKQFIETKLIEKLPNVTKESSIDEIQFHGDASKNAKETKMLEKTPCAGGDTSRKKSENLDVQIEMVCNNTEENAHVKHLIKGNKIEILKTAI